MGSTRSSSTAKKISPRRKASKATKKEPATEATVEADSKAPDEEKKTRAERDLDTPIVDPLPPASPALSALAEKLQADSAPLIASIVDEMRDLPDYQKITDSDFWREINEAVSLNAYMFYRVVVKGFPFSRREADASRLFSRRRLAQGISLPNYLHAYRIGVWRLWDDLVDGARGKSKLESEVLDRASWIFRHFELLSSFLADSYFREAGREAERGRALAEFFGEVFDGGGAPDSELTEEATQLGIDLDAPFHLVAIRRDGRWRGFVRNGEKVPGAGPPVLWIAEAADVRVDRLICAERKMDWVALIPRTEVEHDHLTVRSFLREIDSRRNEGRRATVGMSGLATKLQGLREAYREAVRALDIGPTTEPKEKTFYYPDLAIDDLLDSNRTARRRLVRDTLGKLLEEDRGSQQYIETLDAYFRAGLSVKVAAGILDIHPNTLAYRMRRITELTGLDPTNTKDRLRVEIATRLVAMEHRRKAAEAEGAPRT